MFIHMLIYTSRQKMSVIPNRTKKRNPNDLDTTNPNQYNKILSYTIVGIYEHQISSPLRVSSSNSISGINVASLCVV